MCNNAREYTVEGSQSYNDATAIMRFTRKKRVEVAAQFPDVPDADDGPPSSGSSSTGSVTPVTKSETPHQARVKKERKRNLTGDQEQGSSPNRGPGLGNRIQRGVYKAITAAKDQDGRQVASIFFVKPNRAICKLLWGHSRAVDLKTIDMKITKSLWSIDDMMADVFLMFKNAKQYNSQTV